MTVSVIIPVYNEQATIRDIIQRVRAVDLDLEIIIVDDGSTDGTCEILESMAAAPGEEPLIVAHHQANRGKGAAVRTGLPYVTGEVVVIQDADLEYDPAEYFVLLQPILDGRADVVYGSRFLGNGPHRVLFFWHMVGNKLLTLLSNVFTNLNMTDMETGYKMVRTDILKGIALEQNRFGFEPELTAKLSHIDNIRFYEVGISYFGRPYSEGKKITWRDGVWAIWYIVKYWIFR